VAGIAKDRFRALERIVHVDEFRDGAFIQKQGHARVLRLGLSRRYRYRRHRVTCAAALSFGK
jgi:hypothetical protein